MLTVYRRHLRTCKSAHDEGLRTTEFDERKKGVKRCHCRALCSMAPLQFIEEEPLYVPALPRGIYE
jgi:hypothetical protein